MGQVAFSLFLLAAFFTNRIASAIKAEAATTECRSLFESSRNSFAKAAKKLKLEENLKRECSECVYDRINREARKNAEKALERPLTEKEAQALLTSYHAERFLPRFSVHLKKRILKEGGFSEDDIEEIPDLIFDWFAEPRSILHAPQTKLNQSILSETVPEKENNQVVILNLDDNDTPLRDSDIGVVGRILQSLSIEDSPPDGLPKAVLLEVPNVKTGKINQIKLNINEIDPQDGEINYIKNGQDYRIYAGIPEIRKIFAAYQSKRKILSIKELNLPDNTPSEYGMKGLSSQYAKGWPEVQEWIAFGKAIRNLKKPPHPLKTHIEYFAFKLPLHIEYIRKGIVLSEVLNFKEKQKALHLLNELEQTALRRIKEKAVTYSWWLHFNLELVGIFSTEMEESGSSAQQVEEVAVELNAILSVFPVFLSLPVIQGELGRAALSRAFANGIMPIGLVTEPPMVHERLLEPLEFAEHDLSHARAFISYFSIYSHLYEKQRMNTNYLEFMGTLSGKQREAVEDKYFFLTHEIF